MRIKYMARMLPMIAMVAGAFPAHGQDYPSRPVRIVTAEPGGGNDLAARAIAQSLTASWPQQVIVDNRGGAGGARAAQTVAQASPDGYTVLLYSNTLWIGPLLRRTTPFDPDKDYAPITLADRAPNILVLHPSVPASSVKELIALAKAKPGALNYSSASPGGSVHLSGELFKSMAGVNIVHVPYKGTGASFIDFLAGHVQMTFGTAASVAQHAKAGRLKALAVTSLQPSALVPGMPTMAAAGLPGYESVAFHAMFATARTPANIVRKLNQEIVRVLNSNDVKDKFLSMGIETMGTSPSEMTATIKSEMARMGKVIKEVGLTYD